jgi:hypothetical protein
MKDAFPEYYTPTQDQFDALWRDCMFRKTDTILNSEPLESLKTLRATNLPDAARIKITGAKDFEDISRDAN